MVQVRRYVTFSFGGRLWEVPASRELVLEGDTTGCGVRMLKDGAIFQIVHDRTIIRRVGGY